MQSNARSRRIPPPLELECLKALWVIGQGTVKDVRKLVTEDRRLAYTTVMTILDRLEKRGSVARRKAGRSFVYTPQVGREELQQLAVQELTESFFGGSREELLAFLTGAAPVVSTPEPNGLDTVLL
jgi:predicted transcriptional regulator